MALIALREPKGHVAAHVTASNAGQQSSTQSSSKRSVKPSRTASSAPRHADSQSSTPARTSAKSVPLVVLNNTTISGLAERAAQQFEDGGWTVTRYGNYQNDIISTCAYYDPSFPGSQRAANALQREFPAIKRVKERFPELPNGAVVVVLTPDYSTA